MMMKKFALLILLFFTTTNVGAQEYFPAQIRKDAPPTIQLQTPFDQQRVDVSIIVRKQLTGYDELLVPLALLKQGSNPQVWDASPRYLGCRLAFAIAKPISQRTHTPALHRGTST